MAEAGAAVSSAPLLQAAKTNTSANRHQNITRLFIHHSFNTNET
jgi:hypothetical protein